MYQGDLEWTANPNFRSDNCRDLQPGQDLIHIEKPTAPIQTVYCESANDHFIWYIIWPTYDEYRGT